MYHEGTDNPVNQSNFKLIHVAGRKQKASEISLGDRSWANWLAATMILPALFDHLEERFSYKEVPVKMFCPPPENEYGIPGACKTVKTGFGFLWFNDKVARVSYAIIT